MIPTYDELVKQSRRQAMMASYKKPEPKTIARFSFSAGILVRGSVRNALRSAKFQGLKIEWIENKWFIESDFLVKGPVEDVLKFKKCLEQYAD